MTRKLISWVGVLTAVFGFTVGGADVEARHCRVQRTRCYSNRYEHANYGYYNRGVYGQCCQRSGGYWSQQNPNNEYRNDGQQQAGQTDHIQPTSSTAAVAVDAGPPAAAIRVTAPVPNN